MKNMRADYINLWLFRIGIIGFILGLIAGYFI